MKITKANIVNKSNTNVSDPAEKDYIQSARSAIREAIDILGSVSNSDSVVKDAIANLSVVYFELN